MSEVLNVLQLMMSWLGWHLCPNGHLVEPSIAAYSEEIVCPVCGARFEHPSAESFAFNSSNPPPYLMISHDIVPARHPGRHRAAASWHNRGRGRTIKRSLITYGY